MDVHSTIIKMLNEKEINFIQNKNIDYRCSSIDVDFYLPDTKTMLILEEDPFVRPVLDDLKNLACYTGYNVVIVPIHEINSEHELRNYVLTATMAGENIVPFLNM